MTCLPSLEGTRLLYIHVSGGPDLRHPSLGGRYSSPQNKWNLKEWSIRLGFGFGLVFMCCSSYGYALVQIIDYGC